MRTAVTLLTLLFLARPAPAGLYYSGESFRDLPAKWSGFLPDHRSLRQIASPPIRPTGPVPPLRDQYADAALKLEAASRARALTADEAADLGALYVRLGQPQKAVELLRPAARRHPDCFRTAANLGTAWQLAGDLGQAAAALEDAVRLAPEKWKEAEGYHLKLVRLRRAEGKSPSEPDDLFGTGFPLDPAKLPANAVAVVQQLALWLPADGRLLWLLGELAHAYGDDRTAANILDGCVAEFNLAADAIRDHRTRYRAAADRLEAQQGHRADRGTVRFASPRALARRVDPARLPAIRPTAVNALPWAAVGETEIGPTGKPAFLKYLEQLDGKRVSVVGYVTPVGGEAGARLTGFLLTEYPIGCWFCEAPGPAQIVAVELADGLTVEPTRTTVKVTGTLTLNRTDPERLPVQVADARVGQPD